MRKLRVVDGFYSKSEAMKIATFHREQLKKTVLESTKVEVVNACRFCIANTWFRPTRLPQTGRFMVIVHYQMPEIQHNVIDKTIPIPVPHSRAASNPKKVALSKMLSTKNRSYTGLLYSSAVLITLASTVMQLKAQSPQPNVAISLAA